jgi:Ycf66 protein N-terminus
MMSFQLNLTTLSGFALVYLGLRLFFFGQSSRPVRVSAIVLAILHLVGSLILIFYSWRFDIVMQFGQFLLTLTSAYWVLKETQN